MGVTTDGCIILVADGFADSAVGRRARPFSFASFINSMQVKKNAE
jgi:hypothetical protein